MIRLEIGKVKNQMDQEKYNKFLPIQLTVDSQTIILSGLVSSVPSLIVSLIITRYRFYRMSQKKEKEEIEDGKKDIRKHLRKIQGRINDLISENAKKDRELHKLDSFDRLDESIEECSDRVKEAPIGIDKDLEMTLWKVESLWSNMNFWEVYNEKEIRDEFWFEADKAKKKVEEEL